MTTNVIIVYSMAAVLALIALYRLFQNSSPKKPKRKLRTDLGMVMIGVISMLSLLSQTGLEIFEFGPGNFFAIAILTALVMGRYELIKTDEKEEEETNK